MKAGVVDIGTNSMRLLITSPRRVIGRWVRVTGLGRGVDETGVLSDEAISRSMEAFVEFGEIMDAEGVDVKKAIATSASRDASNREEFFDLVEGAIGVRPTLITGEVEARYAFDGATGDAPYRGALVSDIGGGSTEFVTETDSISVDIGSVRLTDRIVGSHPVSGIRVDQARSRVSEMFHGVGLIAREVVGVAGTWTSLSAIVHDLPRYEADLVHNSTIGIGDLTSMIDVIAPMVPDEVESIPALDPKRAPVILAGAILAEQVLARLSVEKATISERDTLDGVARELLASLEA